MERDGRGISERVERAADRNAAGWLFAATCSGAVLGMFRQLAGPGALNLGLWPFRLAEYFGAGLASAVLLVAVWALTARHEARLGIRQQRGAMAALAGLAVFSIPFSPELVFSPVFGIALLLLAVRTRDSRTAAMGITALIAGVALAVLPDLPGAAAVLGLVGLAALAAAVQMVRAPAAQSR